LEVECKDDTVPVARRITTAQLSAAMAGIGARQSVNLVEWLAGMKTRPNAKWLYVQVLRELGFQLEAEDEGEEDDDEAGHLRRTLGTIAVVGRKHDPEVRRVVAATALRHRLAKNATRVLKLHVKGKKGSKGDMGAKHTRHEACKYLRAMNQEFTLALQFEGSLDDSRFSSSLGSVREHCKCAAMNKSTGRTGWLPPKVLLGKAQRSAARRGAARRGAARRGAKSQPIIT